MLGKLTVLQTRAKNAISYYWKGFLVKIGITSDQTIIKCRRLSEEEVKPNYNHEVAIINERTKEEKKIKALLFSREEIKKVHEAQVKLGI